MTILVPIFVYSIVIYGSRYFTPENQFYIFSSVGVALFVIIFIAFYNYLKPFSGTTIVVSSFLLNLIIVLIILVGLAIYFNTFMNEALKQDGWTGFIANLVFFIPCLISDLVKFVLSEFNMTPMVVYVLFLIEIALVLLYLYVPKIMNQIVTHKGKQLLQGPVDLNARNVISTSSIFTNNNSKTGDKDSPTIANKNFGLSMWIYLNPEKLGTDAIIFKYGQSKLNADLPKYMHTTKKENDTIKTGSPCILYLGSMSEIEQLPNQDLENKNDLPLGNQIKFIFSDADGVGNSSDEATSYIMTLPMQKWNHIAFNYHDNTADLFINGKLERTAFLRNNLPIFRNTDLVTVGDYNGAYGAI
jgi:hypothetical protein